MTEEVKLRRATLAIFLLLAGLVLHNVVLAWDNQDCLFLTDRFHISPRDVQKAAALHDHQLVRGRFAHYYYLQQRAAGTTVYVTPRFAGVAWDLEHVARQDVIINPTPLVINLRKAREEGLRDRIKWHTEWYAGRGRMWPFYIEVRRGEEHVLAISRREFYYVPRSLFEEFALPDSKIDPSVDATRR